VKPSVITAFWQPPLFGGVAVLDANINRLTAELNRLQSEKVEQQWPGLRAAFVSGPDSVDEIAASYRISTHKVYRIARQCGWGKRRRRQSALSCSLVGEKLKARWAAKNGERALLRGSP